eukprot:4940416-Pleurochrysis_carterae.AAC.2
MVELPKRRRDTAALVRRNLWRRPKLQRVWAVARRGALCVAVPRQLPLSPVNASPNCSTKQLP